MRQPSYWILIFLLLPFYTVSADSSERAVKLRDKENLALSEQLGVANRHQQIPKPSATSVALRRQRRE
jgi:hypothetical protein